MSPSRIALAACRSAVDAPPSDLYPNPDWPPLREAFAARGVDAVQLAWDDPEADWSAFDLVTPRSTWDSVERPGDFRDWAAGVADVSQLVNPLPAISWNLDKTYLQELEADGIPVVPTQWVGPDDGWELPTAGEFVVKPAVSSGGRETARYSPEEIDVASSHVRRLQRAGRVAMVQDYLPSVDDEGESKLVFIAGTFSHAVRMRPLLRPAAGVIDRPWEVDVSPRRTSPTVEQHDVAVAALRSIERRVGVRLAYLRVDLVNGRSGAPLVLEAELIEPLLFLPFAPDAAGLLAGAILNASAS